MRTFAEPILVTRPHLPDLESFKTGCAEIWKNRWLSNYGPMVRKFAAALAGFLGVPESNLELLVNGTLALECGFQALGLAGGEVITTPFTFVATSHALKRIGATPVFADIDPETLCLSPAAAEKLITYQVLAASVFSEASTGAPFSRISAAAHHDGSRSRTGVSPSGAAFTEIPTVSSNG